MKLYYDIHDKPKFPQLVIYAVQQLLAIMAATLVVPLIIGHDMQPSAALFGAGIGTLVYMLFTRGKSPVFLGSSFAFIGSMSAAFAGGVSAALGYAGIIMGAVFAGLVYVVIALLIKGTGVNWIDKLMPKQVIGPTVAIIGLSLAGNAIGDLQTGDVSKLAEVDGEMVSQMVTNPLIAVLCGLVALFVTMICSTYGKKSIKLIPFIIGILSGYAVAAIFTVIGNSAGIDALKVIDFSVFSNMSLFEVPNFTILTAIDGIKEIDASYVGTIAAAYLPVAFVVFAEHIADHKNISSIIGKDLLKEPGLDKTLMGDGVGSMVGAIFGGCPNTTYGESVACVAITKNASVATIRAAAIGAILISFFSPFVAFVDSIPACVMGGVCMALYGFIAVSGLKMIQSVDLEDNRNLFTVSVILISGIGGLTLSFGNITITAVACALILGIITNFALGKKKA